MINLMYLVLTALLALNVSNEILNAFKVLAKGISDSNVSIDQKTNQVYNDIKANEEQPGQREKVRPFRIKADEVKKRSDDLVKYIENWKERIVAEAGGRFGPGEKEAGEIKREDNIDATTLLLVERKGGDTLRNRMAELRQFMLQSVMPKDSGLISPLMPLKVVAAKPTDHNPKGDWNIAYFEHMPTIAALALFSKFQNDVRSSEALVINKLFEEAHLSDIKFDTITAVAVPKTSYALEGDKIEAQILLAAFNKSNKPIVTISTGGGSKKEAVNGVVPWETVASGTGLQTVSGSIRLETGDAPIVRPWKFEYMVGTTGASVQLDKMNVFYIGVDNPITVAAAGYSVEDVSIEVQDANVKGEKGKYVINVTKPGRTNVKINAKTKDGSIKQVGGLEVRVKRIPDPVAMLGKVSSGSMSAAEFRVQIAPAAVLAGFDFEAKFKITAFDFSMLPKGKDYQGPHHAENRAVGTRFSDNANIPKLIQAARPGDRVFIEGIKAVGPDGTTRTLNPIVLTLN
jgi:gliding motility-associated protein GldM